MAASPSAVSDKLLLAQIRRHLEGLKRSPDGSFLYGLIERGLKRYGSGAGDMEQAFVAFLHGLLARYMRSPAGDAATRFKARILLQYLAPLVAGHASGPPADATPRSTPRINKWQVIDALMAAGGKTAASRAAPPAISVGARKLEKMQEKIADKLTDALAGSPALEMLLKDNPDPALRAVEIGDHEDLRRIFIRGIRELIEGHQVLRENLKNTQAYLQEVVSDRKVLREALGKTRRNVPTDETTGLLRRAFFMKQFEAEVGRASRYGFSLALCLVHLEGLENIGERYGVQAVEEILRRLAGEMQAQFRGHDLIARLGEDEFAVLLPNTYQQGALLAVKKLRKHAARLQVAHEGRDIPLPDMHCALACYSPEETAALFLLRARQALEQARQPTGAPIELAPAPARPTGVP